MNRKSLYVTTTADCEELANTIFPNWSERELTDEDENDDGTWTIRYDFDAEVFSSVEANLNVHPHVIRYQIM